MAEAKAEELLALGGESRQEVADAFPLPHRPDEVLVPQ
jgi:hypothetical protein